MWGLLVADAMGVPHEFKRSDKIPKALQMVMPPDYDKTYRDVPYGTWSDDSSLALALADSLATKRCVDLADFASRMLKWYEHAEYTPDGNRFDIGTTTRRAFIRLANGISPLESGQQGADSQSNGSLMRTLPLALWHIGHDRDLYLDACKVSAVTHAHPICQASCGIYCVAARYVLIGDDPKSAFRTAMKMTDGAFKFQLVKGGPDYQLDTLVCVNKGSGYVLDGLAFAMHALENLKWYRQAVEEAIRLGNDTDTTACIAGGIVAIRDGLESIPIDWRNNLQGVKIASDIIERLVANRVPGKN